MARPGAAPARARDISRDGRRPEKRARLEAIYLRDVVLQSRRLSFYLRDSAAAKHSAARSTGAFAGQCRLLVQHRDQFYHEHELAELRRRNNHVLLLPNGRA